MSEIRVSTSGGIIFLDVREAEGREWVSLVAYKELLNEVQGLNREIGEMRKGRVVSAGEVEEMTRIRQEHMGMKEQLDSLTVFIRENYKREIELGQHGNMRTSVDAAKLYLGRERMMKGDR